MKKYFLESKKMKKIFSLKNKSIDRLEKITLFMGLVGQFATYIQAFKIFYLGSAESVSFIASTVSVISMGFWLFYGIRKKSKPLVICNIFGLIGFFLVISGILVYGKNYF